MANRRASWRRAPASAQPHHRRPQKNQTALPFSGVEDHAVLTLFTHLLAKKVNVNAINGAVYSGLFAGTQHSPNSNDLLLTLRYARLVRGKPVPSATVHDLRGNTAARIHIPFSRVTTVLGAPFENAKRDFATDSQISRGSTGVGRQLQRFDDFTNIQNPNTNNAPTLDQQTFGSLASNAPRDKWDQFQVNQAKFGVTTSFDESEYTTPIDRNSKDFAQRQREADRLAEEIESAPSQNPHVREERNQEVGTDCDEEARYSGVLRPQSTTQHPSRTPVLSKDTAPERPRLSYAAAAAAAPNVDPRQQILSKPPSAGATHLPASANKSPSTQVKNAGAVSKPTPTAGSKHNQQSGKASQDQPAKHSQSASRSSHSVSAKNAPPTGRAASQSSKSGNKKAPVVTKPQQQQGKNMSSNNKASNQTANNKSASQTANSRQSTQATTPKSTASAAQAKTPAVSARTTTPSQTATTSQEQLQTKPAAPKTTTPTSVSNKDKAPEERPKPVVKERPSRDNLPQIVKVRAALTGRTSPSPSRNSPLPAPAVADTSAIGVLNLDAQTPNLEQIKRFEAYKTNREFQSIAANREKITDDLKKFSTQLDSRNGSLRRGQNGGSSTPGTPRSASRAAKSVAEGGATEKAPDTPSKKDASTANEDVSKEMPRSEVESNVAENADTKPVDKPEESAPKPRPKSKSKLNPNAQEFKLNPDAPSFTPSSQKAQVQNATPYVAYNQPGSHVEYSQQLQVPPGYAMPIQTMTPMPYGPQSYVVVPTVPTPVAGGGGSPYPFVQQPSSFGPAHVGGRFPQSAAMPVSYGYPHVTPMVIAQPPQQRVPASPYYHSPGPYAGGQAAPGHMTAPHQAHLYQQGAPPHLQGGTLPMTGRGGHGNPRRGGSNRSRGKTSLQQSYPHVPSTASGERVAPKSPEGARSPDGTQL